MWRERRGMVEGCRWRWQEVVLEREVEEVEERQVKVKVEGR